MIFEPHSDQQDAALFSDRRLTVCATGIQWGKTTVGVMWLKTFIHQYTRKDDHFIITAPTYPILEQSTLPPFLNIMDGLGTYNKKENAFTVYRGGKIFVRTGTNPDSVVGITNVRAILCDEAGLYSLYFWQNIQGRSSFFRAPIMIVTSPYSQNWLYKEIIRPINIKPKSRPNVLLIQATSKDNPFFPAEEYHDKHRTMDPRRFNMMYGGQFGRMEGLVYDCFHDHENQVPAFILPEGTQYVGGIDWGYSHPFVLTTRGITPEGRHFQVSEFVKTGLTIKNILSICKQNMSVWGTNRFYCGPDRPENIKFLQANGIPATAANNDVKLGIDLHYELIKSRRYKVFTDSSPHTVDEYAMYHWPSPEDLKPDQDEKERNPVKQNDDVMDSNRYITIMTYKRGTEKKVPKINEETDRTQETRTQRIKRLKRPKPNWEEV